MTSTATVVTVRSKTVGTFEITIIATASTLFRILHNTARSLNKRPRCCSRRESDIDRHDIITICRYTTGLSNRVVMTFYLSSWNKSSYLRNYRTVIGALHPINRISSRKLAVIIIIILSPTGRRCVLFAVATHFYYIRPLSSRRWRTLFFH